MKRAAINVIDNCSIYERFVALSLLEQCVLSLYGDAPMTHASLSDETMIPRRSVVPMSILIVDDEETTRELCVTVAAQAGLRAAAVPSAEQALDLLEHSAIDILLADLKLPGMGWARTSEVRE